jgi:hypothetical protein
MQSILKQINDPEVNKLVGCIKPEWSHSHLIQEYYRRKTMKHSKYDPTLLWLLMYEEEYSSSILQYLDASYTKFKQILDAGFAQKLVSAGRFHSHVWEIVLCDVLSSYGTLIPKKEGGADFLLQTRLGQIIQVEAVTPNESEKKELQSTKPVYDEDNFFSHSGNVNDEEKPIVLRFLQAFDDKAETEYRKDIPLIIAINTSKVVGLSTMDDFVLRQALFGLGCQTITYHTDGSYSPGLQQTPQLDKGGGPFPIARFRDPAYSHISGVIYSSQKPYGLTPGGYGWTNSGLVYVPNPLATQVANIDFDCMGTIICTETVYKEEKAKVNFKSSFESL